MTESIVHSPTPGISITCGRCGQTAASTRRFCGACGARLWEPCLGCKTCNSIAERYCSECGADMPLLLEAALRLLEERTAQSAALEQQGNLLDAARCLQELPDSEHSQLAPRLEAARKRHTELATERERVVAQREAIIHRAQQLHDQRDYASAQVVLEQVPASLRDQQMRSLLATATNAVREIGDLRSQLRRSVRDGVTHDLLPIVERLMELEPRAEDVRRLYDQLRLRETERNAGLAERLLKQARDSIVRNGYRRAEECLAQIPPTVVQHLGVEQRKQFAAIDERVWLAKQLRVAPFANNTLLLMAARLVKLQPRDDQARKCHEEIAARLAGNGRRHASAIVPWAKSNGEWPLGAPVEPINSISHLQWDEANAKLASWSSGMRRHLVAVGLALHGVGLGRLNLDLSAKDNASWFERLAGSARNRARPAAWGLDFGTSALKVVHLSRAKDVVTIENSAILEYAENAFGAEGADVRPHFAAALQSFVEKCDPGNEPLVVGFPGAQSFGRFFSLPESKGKKLQSALEFEVRNQIPLPLDQVVYNAEFWDRTENADARRRRVALVAAKRAHVDLRLAPFVESTARAAALQSDCIALANFFLYSQPTVLDELEPDEGAVVVEVGDVATNIVGISPSMGLWFRTIFRGIHSLNKSLVAAIGVTWEQADQFRRQWNGTRPLAEIDRAIAPALDELTREVRRALRAFNDATSCRVARIHVAGGGCEQFGLLREWSRSHGAEPSPSAPRHKPANGAPHSVIASVQSDHNDDAP